MKKGKKKDDRDGTFTNADYFESHPDFQSEYELMSDEFLEENNPKLLEIQKRLRSNADKGPA